MEKKASESTSSVVDYYRQRRQSNAAFGTGKNSEVKKQSMISSVNPAFETSIRTVALEQQSSLKSEESDSVMSPTVQAKRYKASTSSPLSSPSYASLMSNTKSRRFSIMTPNLSEKFWVDMS